MRDQRVVPATFSVVAVLAVFAILAITGQLWAAAPGTAAEPEVKVAKADLERLPGSYANEEMGFAFKIDLQDGRVRLAVTQGPPFPPALLIPTSATHFRWEGEGLAPGLAVSFQVTGSKAESLTVIQPGKPLVVMKRVE